jgi:hypothetical protein
MPRDWLAAVMVRILADQCNEVIYPGLAHRCGGIAKVQPLLLAVAITAVAACCVHAGLELMWGAATNRKAIGLVREQGLWAVTLSGIMRSTN